MRNVVAIGSVLLAAGCAAVPSGPPIVTWQYGAGNGDGVAYPGPPPIYSRAYGMSDGVSSGQTANTSYAYGADGQTGVMVQMTTPPKQMVAQPTPQPQAPAPNQHL